MRKLLMLLFLLPVFIGCSSNNNSDLNDNATAYDKMHIVFQDKPDVESISKLMDAVLDQYKMEHTEENKEKFGSALLKMREESAVNVSEMDILKYMYQNPNTIDPLPTAIAKAATVLEKIH